MYPRGSVRPKSADRDHDRRGGARLDAEDPGVGQRVAGERLHERAGEAERDADGEAHQRPRHAQLAHDRRRLRAVVAEQAGRDVAERDRLGADGDAEHAHERRARRRTEGSPASRGSVRRSPSAMEVLVIDDIP